MSDLTTLTSQLANMKQRMIDRLTAQGKTGYTMSDTMEDIVAAYETLRGLDYCTDTITENGSYIAPNGKTGYNNFIVNVPAGGPTTHKKYNLLDRVYEDINGDSIGTVCGFHYDANNIEYAVVALDAVYRNASIVMCSGISSMTYYTTYNMFDIKSTATQLCDIILQRATGNTSPAVEYARSKVFSISGSTYIGQIPTPDELAFIMANKASVYSLDPTISSYSSLALPDRNVWCCIMFNSSTFVSLLNGSGGSAISYNGNGFLLPILEIPNVVVSE